MGELIPTEQITLTAWQRSYMCILVCFFLFCQRYSLCIRQVKAHFHSSAGRHVYRCHPFYPASRTHNIIIGPFHHQLCSQVLFRHHCAILCFPRRKFFIKILYKKLSKEIIMWPMLLPALNTHLLNKNNGIKEIPPHFLFIVLQYLSTP